MHVPTSEGPGKIVIKAKFVLSFLLPTLSPSFSLLQGFL